MSFRIVGLSGPAQAGKTTTALYLAEKHNFQRTAFANLLRRTAIVMYPWLDWMLRQSEYDKRKEIVDSKLGITPRKVLQLLGTEVGRNIWPDTWVDGVRREIEAAQDENFDGLAIEDVRFPNEVEMVRELDGQLWSIRRPEAGGEVGVTGHESEAYATEFHKMADHWIVNNATFNYLYGQIDSIIDFGVNAAVIDKDLTSIQ